MDIKNFNPIYVRDICLFKQSPNEHYVFCVLNSKKNKVKVLLTGKEQWIMRDSMAKLPIYVPRNNNEELKLVHTANVFEYCRFSKEIKENEKQTLRKLFMTPKAIMPLNEVLIIEKNYIKVQLENKKLVKISEAEIVK